MDEKPRSHTSITIVITDAQKSDHSEYNPKKEG